jgi:uncharacterized protein (DUF952 family)
MSTLYRIVSLADWESACAAGAFRGTAHDERDGYIHLSAAHQVLETAAKHYAGKPDLLLLYVRAELLGQLLEAHGSSAGEQDQGPLRWEVSRGGDLFPHLYGVLPVAAVTRVERLPLGADGKHLFPQLDAHVGPRPLEPNPD